MRSRAPARAACGTVALGAVLLAACSSGPDTATTTTSATSTAPPSTTTSSPTTTTIPGVPTPFVPMQTATGGEFVSPSGNIGCEVDFGPTNEGALCLTFSPPRSVHMTVDGVLTQCIGQQCLSNAGLGTPTLAYGTADRRRSLPVRVGHDRRHLHRHEREGLLDQRGGHHAGRVIRSRRTRCERSGRLGSLDEEEDGVEQLELEHRRLPVRALDDVDPGVRGRAQQALGGRHGPATDRELWRRGRSRRSPPGWRSGCRGRRPPGGSSGPCGSHARRRRRGR